MATLAIECRSTRWYSRMRTSPRAGRCTAVRAWPLAAGAGAAEHGDGVGEAADQRGAVVDAQQVVEDLGAAPVVVLHLPQFTGLAVDDRLDAPGDADEGALGGVAARLLVVDDFEDLADLLAQRLGQMAVGHVRVDDVAHHLFGRIAHAQPLDGGRHDFLGQPHRLGVVRQDPVVQVGDALLVLRPLHAHGVAAACSATVSTATRSAVIAPHTATGIRAAGATRADPRRSRRGSAPRGAGLRGRRVLLCRSAVIQHGPSKTLWRLIPGCMRTRAETQEQVLEFISTRLHCA